MIIDLLGSSTSSHSTPQRSHLVLRPLGMALGAPRHADLRPVPGARWTLWWCSALVTSLPAVFLGLLFDSTESALSLLICGAAFVALAVATSRPRGSSVANLVRAAALGCATATIAAAAIATVVSLA